MDYALTRPIPDIWTAARDMFTRLRRSTHYKQWLYALEALVRKLVLLEALALAPPLPKLRPIQLPLIYTKLPAPPRERSAERGHAFRLWPRTKAHPARIRLLGKPQSRAELDRDTLYQAQLERLKRARLNRPAPVQLMLRRLNALSRVLENRCLTPSVSPANSAARPRRSSPKSPSNANRARRISIRACNATPNSTSGPPPAPNTNGAPIQVESVIPGLAQREPGIQGRRSVACPGFRARPNGRPGMTDRANLKNRAFSRTARRLRAP